MSSINTGGPAFPGTEANGLNSGWSGMDLRDYFAAKAMNAYWNDPEVSEFISMPENVAKWAYEMADAMLKARGA